MCWVDVRVSDETTDFKVFCKLWLGCYFVTGGKETAFGDKVIKVVVGEGDGWEGRAQQVLLGRLSSRW